MTYLHFSSDPAIPITLHPWFLAYYTTKAPAAPAAAETTTVSPFLGLPTSKNPK